MALTKLSTDSIDLSGNTTALTLPSGTTAQRPSSATEGILRNNTTTGALEFYDGSLWQQIAGTLVPDNAPSSNFNTVLYTGNRPSTQSITGVGFQPDLVWVKVRSANGYGAVLADSVEGAQKFLDTSNANQQIPSATSLVSFDTDGFSVGGYGNWNGGLSYANGTMVSWNWKAGGNSNTYNIDGTGYGTASAASLDGGTITPTGASVNTTTGFSIIQYTGNSTAGATVAHGLTVIPELVIIKSTNDSRDWIVGSSGIDSGSWSKILQLNLADGEATYSGFNNTSPTNTVFSLGSQNAVNVGDYIAYCFHSVDGYQKIGVYTGNGNATGPIVQTGFEPAWLMVKNISTTKYWYVVDNKRSTTNPRNKELYPNNTDAEVTMNSVNFVNTGFEIVTTDSGYNTLNDKYLYLAISS